jgi:hypothetical protein
VLNVTGIASGALSVSSDGDALVLSLGGTDRITLVHAMSDADGLTNNGGWGVGQVVFTARSGP